MGALPIPEFRSVKEIYGLAKHHLHGFTEITLIAPSDNREVRRYTVLRIWKLEGRIECIGRELKLGHARGLAKRPSSRDGQPLSEAERYEIRQRYPTRPGEWFRLS